jgi:hypothetical protein
MTAMIEASRDLANARAQVQALLTIEMPHNRIARARVCVCDEKKRGSSPHPHRCIAEVEGARGVRRVQCEVARGDEGRRTKE